MSGQQNLDINDRGDEPAGRRNWDVAGELKSLEARLATLSPRPDRLDRDRLMFLAGKASLADAKVENVSMLGVKLESRAWPAAFAAMSAVAATLFVMLVTRPETLVQQPLPSADIRIQANPRVATDHRSNDFVLSPLDARIDDIDRWLTREELRRNGAGPKLEQIQYRSVPILTPARWDQVLNESDPIDASPTGASNLRRNQGARS